MYEWKHDGPFGTSRYVPVDRKFTWKETITEIIIFLLVLIVIPVCLAAILLMLL